VAGGLWGKVATEIDDPTFIGRSGKQRSSHSLYEIPVNPCPFEKFIYLTSIRVGDDG